MFDWYMLDENKNPVPVETPLGWGDNRKIDTQRRVAETKFPNGTWVSTVFLGLDHNFNGGTPILFETMVFPKDDWGELDCERYCTYNEAVEGHQTMVEKWKDK